MGDVCLPLKIRLVLKLLLVSWFEDYSKEIRKAFVCCWYMLSMSMNLSLLKNGKAANIPGAWHYGKIGNEAPIKWKEFLIGSQKTLTVNVHFCYVVYYSLVRLEYDACNCRPLLLYAQNKYHPSPTTKDFQILKAYN